LATRLVVKELSENTTGIFNKVSLWSTQMTGCWYQLFSFDKNGRDLRAESGTFVGLWQDV